MSSIPIRPLIFHRQVSKGSAAIKVDAPSVSSIQTPESALLQRISQRGLRTTSIEIETTRRYSEASCFKEIDQSRITMPFYGLAISTTESISTMNAPGNSLNKGITKNSMIRTRYISFPIGLHLLTTIRS